MGGNRLSEAGRFGCIFFSHSLLTASPCSKPSSSRAGRRVRHVRTDTRRPLLLHRKFALTKKLCRRRVSDHTSKGRFCGARHSVESDAHAPQSATRSLERGGS